MKILLSAFKTVKLHFVSLLSERKQSFPGLFDLFTLKYSKVEAPPHSQRLSMMPSSS